MTLDLSATHSRRLRQAALLLAVVAFVALGGLTYRWFASRDRLIVWDFYAPWFGLRAMLREGLSPYSDQVLLSIQETSYGRAAYAHEDQHSMAYPLSIVVIIGPLTALPLPVAQGVWLVLLEVSLLGFLAVAPRAVGWRGPLWLYALTALFTLGLYSTVWALILGQISVVIALLVAVAWWGLRSGRWAVAGACLALATVKPQLTFLLVPGLLVWAAYRRRWRVLIAFAVTLAFTLLLPLLWLPDWPLQWLRQAGRYADSTFFEPPLRVLIGSADAAWVVGGLLLAWLAAWCWRNRSQSDVALGWAPAMLITVGALVAPRTSQANQLILLLPWFFVFSRLRPLLTAFVEMVLLVTTWFIALWLLPAVSHPDYTLWQHRLISPILPLGLTAALLILTPVHQREAA